MTEESGQSRRMCKRIFVNFTGFFKDGAQQTNGTIEQISEGGAILRVAARLVMKSKGVLHINAFAGEPAVAIGGEIIYELPGGKGKSEGWKYGIRFSGLDIHKHESLARLLMFVSVRERYHVKKNGAGTGTPDAIR